MEAKMLIRPLKNRRLTIYHLKTLAGGEVACAGIQDETPEQAATKAVGEPQGTVRVLYSDSTDIPRHEKDLTWEMAVKKAFKALSHADSRVLGLLNHVLGMAFEAGRQAGLREAAREREGEED